MIRTFICGCVKNNETYLENVFNNIDQICNNVDDYYIIIAYDVSNDKSLDILLEKRVKYENKMDIIINSEPLTKIRTQNIANARNLILDKIKSLNKGFEYFIMMDMDDVCSEKINIDVFNYVMNKEKTTPLEWDALSFNRNHYYDIWALSIYPYTFSLFHYSSINTIRKKMHDYLKRQLLQCAYKDKNDGLLRCISAFNGFAIYRTSKFIDSRYEWNINKLLKIYPKSIIDVMSKHCLQTPFYRQDDCEHRYFHIYASKQNGAKICISPMYLFF